jgi:hypothetical protein
MVRSASLMVSSAEQLNEPLRNDGLPIGSELGMDHLQSSAEACRWRYGRG